MGLKLGLVMLSAAKAIAITTGALAQDGGNIETAGPQGPLRGTIVLAENDAPVVLIIPGSGPTDRDGNSPLGINAAPYRLLAEGLAAEGIASVRTDKRGMFGSQSTVANANAVSIGDYVHDTGAWANAIRAQTGAKCVWLLGHSEGGLVALASAAEVDHLCGLILVATPGRPLGDILKEQLHANPANGPLLGAANKAIDQLAAGRRVDTAALPPALEPLFNSDIQGFLISTFALDPAELARKTKIPMLILQGQRDLQVLAADAARLKQFAPKAKLVMLPDTNHVLKQVKSDDREANLATYVSSDLPLAHGVVDAIAQFVKSF